VTLQHFVAPELGVPVRTIGRKTFDFSRHVVVMGIVNRTVDSFYERGRTFGLEAAAAAAGRAVAGGGEWLDLGAVPFSPLAAEVSEADEIDRLVPLIREIRAGTDAVISVDTFRSAVARECLAAGADAVNDTSGLFDPGMAGVVAEAGATLVVTHSKAAPREWFPRPAYDDVVDEVRAVLLDRVRRAQDGGVAPDRIVIDPGHDLNKNTHHSLELTRRLGELAGLGYPLLASVSNKDFIAETLGLPVDRLVEGTVAAVVLCVLQGARIVRVHDVAAVSAAVRLVEATLGWRPPEAPRHNLD
jgi:dihydropteroate synthase